MDLGKAHAHGSMNLVSVVLWISWVLITGNLTSLGFGRRSTDLVGVATYISEDFVAVDFQILSTWFHESQ